NDLSGLRIAHAADASGNEEFVIDLRIRKGVKCKTAVAQKIVKLRRLIADEDVQAAVRDDRANGVNARAAVLPNRREITKSDAELIDERAAGFSHGGAFCRELIPTLHPWPPAPEDVFLGPKRPGQRGHARAYQRRVDQRESDRELPVANRG